MKKYNVTKAVHAELMTHNAYLESKQMTHVPMDRSGYVVVFDDEHNLWLPRVKFEEYFKEAGVVEHAKPKGIEILESIPEKPLVTIDKKKEVVKIEEVKIVKDFSKEPNQSNKYKTNGKQNKK